MPPSVSLRSTRPPKLAPSARGGTPDASPSNVIRALVVALLVACSAEGPTSADAGGSGGHGASNGSGSGGASSGGSASGASAPGGSSSGGSSTGGNGTGGAGAGGEGPGGAGGAQPFVLETHTSTATGVLALDTNLPRIVADCQLVLGAPCEDLDGDGLVDAWEAAVLDRLRPTVVFDEDEPLVDEPTAVVGLVGRVTPASEFIHVYMMLGYSKDYGSCGGFTGHNGDSERVALKLGPAPSGDLGDAVVVAAFTTGHEGTANDHSMVFEGTELSMLSFPNELPENEPRWEVFSSSAKHATYPSIAVCEGVSFIPCLDEDCGPDGVTNVALHRRVFPFVNAGEEAMPLVDDLTALGFPGDTAWGMEDFCGGLGGSGCSAPVRDKITSDPF